MPESKQVTCNGRLCEIDRFGRRVWLDEPPAEVLADILYDQRRAMAWPQLRKQWEEEE